MKIEPSSDLLICSNCALRFNWQSLPEKNQDLASAQCPRCNQRVEKPASCGQTGACFSCSLAHNTSSGTCHDESAGSLNFLVNLHKKPEISWQKRVRKTWENILLKIQSLTGKIGF